MRLLAFLRVCVCVSCLRSRRAQKMKNDAEVEEGWVYCDACEGWVHQICGLFNKGRNNKDDHYNCPDCLLKGLDMGLRKRIETRPQSMLEAKDLPTCKLSDMITERLNIEIARELGLRAESQVGHHGSGMLIGLDTHMACATLRLHLSAYICMHAPYGGFELVEEIASSTRALPPPLPADCQSGRPQAKPVR